DVLADVDSALRAQWAKLGGRCIALTAGDTAGVTAPPDVLLLAERDGLLAGWLRERDAVALVARPDRYVYGIARSEMELRRLLRELSDGLAQWQPCSRGRAASAL